MRPRHLLSLVRAAFGACRGRGLDLPRRVVRNVHGEITACSSQFGHVVAGKRLASGDPVLYLPLPPVMICVPHFMSGWEASRSRVSKVEKITSPSLSVSAQPIDVLLVAQFHIERGAPSRHFVEHRLALQVLRRAHRLEQSGRSNPFHLKALHGPENEMSDVGCRSFLSYACASSAWTEPERTTNAPDRITVVIKLLCIVTSK